MRDGVRRVTEVSEVLGMEEDVIVLSNIFNYEFDSENEDGILEGRFVATPARPGFLPRLEYYGVARAFLEAVGIGGTEKE
jgi:pilus assembly protein CpaF